MIRYLLSHKRYISLKDPILTLQRRPRGKNSREGYSKHQNRLSGVAICETKTCSSLCASGRAAALVRKLDLKHCSSALLHVADR